MQPFKFLSKPIPIQPPGNMYLMFNMDDAIINVIRWRQYHNIHMINSSDTELTAINVPIVNCWLRILSFSYLNPVTTNGDMIEIHYRVIELNNRGTDFIFRMNQQEFIRRIDITGI